MKPKDCLIAALEGQEPDHTPYSIYDFFIDDINGDKWKRLLDKGLLVTNAAITVKHIEYDVIISEETIKKSDGTYRIITKKTPIGSIRQVFRNNWYHEFWLKSPKDYKIMQWIIEHTEPLPDYDKFEQKQQEVGDYGLTCLCQADHPRTPLMLINVDWAGTEQFGMDIASEVPELFELYDASKKLFLKEIEILAKGPGRYVKWLENLSIDTLGPARYNQFLLNIYNEAVPILEAGRKRVAVHYDGQLNAAADLIASSPVHIIESLTEPPEGDMTYDLCRAKWPDKVLWSNINVELYGQSPQQLRGDVIAKRTRMGKKASVFEISEGLPDNWEQSIPVVLETLQELQ